MVSSVSTSNPSLASVRSKRYWILGASGARIHPSIHAGVAPIASRPIAHTGCRDRRPMITLKNSSQIVLMREVGLIVCDVLDAVQEATRPGVSTWQLSVVAEATMRRAGATSAFVGYAPHGRTPYPSVLCTSVNARVVHGIPRKQDVLQEGDIVGVDFACSKQGLFADAARTIGVGRISEAAQRLIDAAYGALEAGIAQCVPGGRLQDIGAAIQHYAETRNYGVVKDYCG